MYVGFENSSTAINVAILAADDTLFDTFRIDRHSFMADDRTVLSRLGDRVDLDEVEMAAYCFAWADAQSSITAIEETTNRGNRGTPGFTPKQADAVIFDQLRASDVPCVTIPGVNDRLECLHPYFRHYAQLSGPDKVADARNARWICRESGGEGETFIVANASSSTRAVVVTEGRLLGAFHWLGLVHGWPDGDIYDAIIAGEVDPRRAVERAGLLYKPGKGAADWEIPDHYAAKFDEPRQRLLVDHLEEATSDERLLELVYWATLHNVYSLVPFAAHGGDSSLERLVVSGRIARVESPFDVRANLTEVLSTVAPTTIADPFGTARGSALIARDIADGSDEVLGIPVETPPAG